MNSRKANLEHLVKIIEATTGIGGSSLVGLGLLIDEKS